MKHRPVPRLCERCDQKIDDRSGWGIMILCSLQSQPSASAPNDDERTQSLIMCGYCLHELALWFAPEAAA